MRLSRQIKLSSPNLQLLHEINLHERHRRLNKFRQIFRHLAVQKSALTQVRPC